MAVDKGPEAIARRLLEASHMSDLRPPFAPHVDMSPKVIVQRLREVGELFALERELRAARGRSARGKG